MVSWAHLKGDIKTKLEDIKRATIGAAGETISEIVSDITGKSTPTKFISPESGTGFTPVPIDPNRRYTPTPFSNAGQIYTKEMADAQERQAREQAQARDRQRAIEQQKQRQIQLKLEQQKQLQLAEQQKLTRTKIIRDIRGARGKWKTQLSERKDKKATPPYTPISTGGLFYVTPKEAEGIEKIGGTRKPIWVIESETPSEIIDIESKYTGKPKISGKDYGYGLSRGQHESNIIQIGLAKEGFRVERDVSRDIKKIQKDFKENPDKFIGKKGFKEETVEGKIIYSFDINEHIKDLPSYKRYENYVKQFTEEGTLKPEVYQKKIIEAKKEFMKLSKKERVLGAAAETQLALFSLPIRAAEGLITFSSKLGVQTFEKGAERTWYGGVKGKDFRFGGVMGEITKTPSVQPSYKFTKHPLKYIGETITTRPSVSLPVGAAVGIGAGLGIAAVKNIKHLGLGVGTKETLKYFSPLRIKSTLFYPEVTGATKFIGKSVQIQKGKQTITKFLGTEKGYPDIKLDVTQISKKGVGISRSTLQTPQFEYLGGELTPGARTTGFLSAFKGKPAGAIGFKGTSATIPLYTSAIDVTGKGYIGVLTKQKPVISRFAGVSQKIPKTKNIFAFTGGEKIGGFEKISPKTYTYVKGFQPQISGYGIKLKLPSTEPTGVRIFRGGRTRTPISKTFTEEIIQEPLQIPSFKAPKIQPTTLKTILPTQTFLSPALSTSLIYDVKQKTLQKGLGVLSTRFDTLQKPEVREKEKLKSAGSLLTGVITKALPREKEAVALAQPLKQKGLLKQQQKQILALSPLSAQSLIMRQKYAYPEEVIGFGFGLGFMRRRKPKIIPDKSAYDVYYLKESTKPRKKQWKKIADNVSRIDALSIGSEKVDKDVSRRFKLSKQKQGIKPKKTKRDDWLIREQKFRPFKIIKDKPFPLHDEWIEKTAYAIDSPQEKRQLKTARVFAMSNLLIGGNSKQRKRRTPFGF